MKKLELNQMENLEGGGGNGFGTGLSCGLTALAITSILTVATAGVGLFAGAMVSGMVCGGSIGWAAAGGSWF